MRFNGLVVLAIGIALLVSSTAWAQPRSWRHAAFGIKGGILTSGTVDATSKRTEGLRGSDESDDSYSFGVFFERQVYRHLQAVLSVDIHDLKKDDSSESFLDIALGAKMAFPTEDGRIAVRPGLSFGYGRLAETHYWVSVDATNYLTVKAYSEFVLYSKQGAGFIVELGLVWGKGGNKDWDIDAGPMTLLRLGVVL